MIHNGSLRVGDFGSSGCASLAAATLASTLQKQALATARKRQALATAADGAADLVDQQQLLVELQALQHSSQLHLQADCTAEAAVLPGAPQQQQHSHTMPARFGVEGDSVSGVLSPSVSGRLSLQAVKDAMNFRIGSIEYMAPEMLDKPTAAEVFHLVSQWLGACVAAVKRNRDRGMGRNRVSCRSVPPGGEAQKEQQQQWRACAAQCCVHQHAKCSV